MTRRVSWECDRCGRRWNAPEDAADGWAPSPFYLITASLVPTGAFGAATAALSKPRTMHVWGSCHNGVFEALPQAVPS